MKFFYSREKRNILILVISLLLPVAIHAQDSLQQKISQVSKKYQDKQDSLQQKMNNVDAQLRADFMNAVHQTQRQSA